MTQEQAVSQSIPDKVLSRWQRMVTSLAEAVGVPAALIMRVGSDFIEVCASSDSDGNPYEEGDSESLGSGLYCERVMETQSELLVQHAPSDPEWNRNPDIKLGMISYLGLPLCWPDGRVFGTICALDNKTNPYSAIYRELLATFRETVESDLEFVCQSRELAGANASKQMLAEQLKIEGQLRQAQKMEAVGTLAGGVAHDFNNLLTAILGGIELALDEVPPNTSGGAALRSAEEAALEASEVTRRLLSLSRKQSRMGGADTKGIVNKVARLLKRTVPKSIEVHVEVGDDIPTVRGDSGQLTQALLNLGINARDAMPDGGTIRFASEVITVDEPKSGVSPGSFVAITVRDTGEGIPKEVSSRVFEPFFTTKPAGTGLGLSMVFNCLKEHGGWVSIESEVGSGTEVQVVLPLTAPDNPGVRSAQNSEDWRGLETVLVVDDTEAVCTIARALLERSGYQVFTALNASDAKQEVEKLDRLDLILTDLAMPQGTGPELMRDLRAAGVEVPMILMSGYLPQAELEEASTGFASFLPKPFDAESIARAVRLALDAELAP